ncbi:MAG: hypothetical protein R3200_14195 [Xanthomonadales bacterium]|nr:hypothetical protein [Xanthomonadales bacterium]
MAERNFAFHRLGDSNCPLASVIFHLHRFLVSRLTLIQRMVKEHTPLAQYHDAFVLALARTVSREPVPYLQSDLGDAEHPAAGKLGYDYRPVVFGERFARVVHPPAAKDEQEQRHEERHGLEGKPAANG